MFDPALLRDDLSGVETRLRTRGLDPSADIARLAELDAERRRLIPTVESLKRESNEASGEIGRAHV